MDYQVVSLTRTGPKGPAGDFLAGVRMPYSHRQLCLILRLFHERQSLYRPRASARCREDVKLCGQGGWFHWAMRNNPWSPWKSNVRFFPGVRSNATEGRTPPRRNSLEQRNQRWLLLRAADGQRRRGHGRQRGLVFRVGRGHGGDRHDSLVVHERHVDDSHRAQHGQRAPEQSAAPRLLARCRIRLRRTWRPPFVARSDLLKPSTKSSRSSPSELGGGNK